MVNFMKEPLEVIEKKLQLVELTMELGKVTREKLEQMATIRDIMDREEALLKQISVASKELHKND